MMKNVMRAAALVMLGAVTGSALGGGTVGYLKLEGELPEREMIAPFLFSKPDRMTFRGLIETLGRVAEDPGLDGLVLRLVDPQLSLARVEEIGRSIERIRGAGKKVHVFTEIYEQIEVVLGSYADEVIVQSGGAVSLTGVYAEEMFLKDTLNWAGVTPDFVQIGDYKGAKEMFAHNAPSPAWEQNINQLLDGVYANMTGHVREGRGLTAQELERAMTDGLYVEPSDAVRFRLADGVVDRLGLDEHLAGVYGEDFRWDLELAPGESGPDLAQMGIFEAFAEMMRMLEGRGRETTRDTIAVVHIDGPIVDGESSGGGFMSGPSVGSLTIREALKEIEDDPNVKGVVVRINSPGGSAIASESIWIGLRRLAEQMPVWASVGDMAASGGYYIAVGTDKIYVNESSIVGSIGVVGGKLAMQGLYDKLHMNVVPRARGPMAGIMGALHPWTDAERAAVTRSMQRVYEQFVERVRATRAGIDISKTGEGRLFTGDKAVGLQMADATGGLEAAIEQMTAELGLGAGTYDVLDYPAPMSIEALLKDGLPLAKAPGEGAIVGALREALGEAAWRQVRDGVTALLQMRREPVLVAMPRVIVFR